MDPLVVEARDVDHLDAVIKHFGQRRGVGPRDNALRVLRHDREEIRCQNPVPRQRNDESERTWNSNSSCAAAFSKYCKYGITTEDAFRYASGPAWTPPEKQMHLESSAGDRCGLMGEQGLTDGQHDYPG